jgi:hypothetical protein
MNHVRGWLAGLAALAAVTTTTTTQAAMTLLAIGDLGGSSDLSGLNYTLENGEAANVLGGIGSGLAYAGGNTFLAIPDRGPNALGYNTAVDNTVSYVSRFDTLNMQLTAAPSGSTLPFLVTPTLTGTTLLYSPSALAYGTGAGLGTQIDGVTPLGSGAPVINDPNHFYFSGRSDNFVPGSSGNPIDARFDPESIRVSNDGLSVFISDEYGPYVRQFDRQTGALIKTFTLPANLDVTNLSPVGDIEIAGNTSGRTANKGMEGLAITPDGKTLVGIMQAALIQDAADPATANMLRIVTIDIATGQTHEYAYMLTKGSGVSDIVAINDHQFLVDERDGKGLGDGSNAKVKQLFLIDLANAQDITGLTGAAAAAAAVTKGAPAILDIVTALTNYGLSVSQIPAKLEGIAFGQDVILNGVTTHTLYVANDNDFVPDTAGGNKFFVFGFTDRDLPGFAPQALAAVPEPSSWIMMIGGFAMIGTMLRLRKRTANAVRLKASRA